MTNNNSAQNPSTDAPEEKDLTPQETQVNPTEEKPIKEPKLEMGKEDKKPNEKEEKKQTLVIQEDDTTVAKLLDYVIRDALYKKASDIHIEPYENEIIVRYRIDGLLQEMLTIDKDLEDALVFKIKVAANMRTDEHFAPQDGRIRFNLDEYKLDTRISILPTTKGPKVVIRLLTQEGKGFSLEELGMRDRELEVVQKSYSKPQGMIVAAGPTGSGKTTTLYSILQLINSPEVNVTTVEDPVEYDIPGINHVQVNAKADLTFANGLRSLLRQDPDVIMIGEIRDKETAQIAINAAMTGHLVLTTIHTNDSVTTVPRLIDMGVEPYLVASTLNVVIAQRLARKLCTKCRKETTLTKEKYDEITKYRDDLKELLKPGEKIYEEVGCKECNGTGFKGRIGIFEILEVTKDIREEILNKADTDKIVDIAKKEGLSLIVEDGIKKLREGVTSISEILRVTGTRD